MSIEMSLHSDFSPTSTVFRSRIQQTVLKDTRYIMMDDVYVECTVSTYIQVMTETDQLTADLTHSHLITTTSRPFASE